MLTRFCLCLSGRSMLCFGGSQPGIWRAEGNPFPPLLCAHLGDRVGPVLRSGTSPPRPLTLGRLRSLLPSPAPQSSAPLSEFLLHPLTSISRILELSTWHDAPLPLGLAWLCEAPCGVREPRCCGPAAPRAQHPSVRSSVGLQRL